MNDVKHEKIEATEPPRDSLKEIQEYEKDSKKENLESDPHKNEYAISIIRQPDGNWIGRTQKFGKVVSVREVGPETVLQKLLTHGGEN